MTKILLISVLLIILISHAIRKFLLRKARPGSEMIDVKDRRWYYINRSYGGLYNFRNPEWHVQTLNKAAIKRLFPEYKFK